MVRLKKCFTIHQKLKCQIQYLCHARISEIKINADVSSWKYIAVAFTVPHDEVCVTKFENLNEYCRWFNGSEFAANDKSEWKRRHSSNQ